MSEIAEETLKELDKNVIMRAKNITKEFPGVKALDDVSIEIRKGEVLALLGENGAGKSTLIKILSGVFTCDVGKIEMEGKDVTFNLPSDATKAGIGIIHQELNYVSTISVAENIFMGSIPKKGLIIDYKEMYRKATEIMNRINVKIDPKMQIGKCSVAQKQLVEIAKVMADDIKVLILDEPTSALNEIETASLLKFIKELARKDVAIIYISHRFDEIFEVSDRVVILRDGCNVGEAFIKETNKESLINMMVGRSIEAMYPKVKATVGDVAIEVKNLTNAVLKDISFSARKGEVMGIYGLMGSGHQNIGSAIFGQDELWEGTFEIEGIPVSINSPSDAMKNSIAYVPAERKTEGLILNSTVKNNIMVAYYSEHKERFLISRRDDYKISHDWVNKFSIKTPSIETKVESLSGGNQQKVVLSKWLELNPRVLILNEPTRGIDVGAKVEIYRILDELCQSGLCIIMITSEMDELLTMSDRIMIMHDGRITGIIEGDEINQESIIKYTMGG